MRRPLLTQSLEFIQRTPTQILSVSARMGIQPRSFEPDHDASREIFLPPSAPFIVAADMDTKISRKFFESFSRKFAS
jgi:hypothetical protein